MAASAQEVVAAGGTLSSALSRALAQAGRSEARRTLGAGAAQVERGAGLLLSAIECAEPSAEDQDWVYTVLSAGAAILDCGSKAAACSEDGAQGMVAHTLTVRILLHSLLVGLEREGWWEALTRLRATTLSPEAMLACFLRLFEKDWDSVRGEGRC